MHFAGKVWRLLVGIKDGLVLVFMLLFFSALFAILTARPSPGAVRDGALLVDLDGRLVEERAEVDPIRALIMGQAPVGEYQARDLVHALDEAARDKRIKAVVLDLDRFLGGGQVHLEEVGEALDRVRASEKPVLVYATAYTDDSMLLAAHASEVWVNPLGGAVIAGPGGQNLYYAGLLDKLKVKARVYKVGEYKSAVEPYIRTGMSDPARENARALYETLWEEYRANLKKARPSLDIDRVTGQPVEWVASARGNLAKAGLEAGLVDKLGTRADFNARIVELVGKDNWGEGPNAYPHTDLSAFLSDKPMPTSGAPIGVITVAGEIVDGDAGPGTAGGDRIAKLLDEALDKDLSALVVRVDSPGGSVLASEEIRNAILRHKARGIPIAVSMANVAASGGYWVSTPGDRIFAEPETITGSIGIFAVIPTFEETAASVGVTSDGVRTTPLSGQPDPIGGFTPEVDSMLQSVIEHGYEDFLNRVGNARGMTRDQVDRVGQGRVWDGGTARQLKLVDEYGGLSDALAWAASKAGLKDGEWHAEYLGKRPSTYDTLLRQLVIGDSEQAEGRDAVALLAGNQKTALVEGAAQLDRLLGRRGAQAYCLACPTSSAATPSGDTLDGWITRLVSIFTK